MGDLAEAQDRRDLKPIGYYLLLRQIRVARGCPLCAGERRLEREYIEHLLHEDVNDATVRNNLLASRGYCRRHAEVAMQSYNTLGVAVLYRDQVERALRSLEALAVNPSPARVRRQIGLEARREPCPACSVLKRSTAASIKLLLAYYRDGPLRQALEEGQGLCLPHLVAALEASGDAEVSAGLVSLHVEKFRRLLADLDGLIRQHDYRFQKVAWGRERDAWVRAVRMTAGWCEVRPRPRDADCEGRPADERRKTQHE